MKKMLCFHVLLRSMDLMGLVCIHPNRCKNCLYGLGDLTRARNDSITPLPDEGLEGARARSLRENEEKRFV